MPSKSLKPCNDITCGNLTRDKYCDEHKKQEAERYKHYDTHHRDKQSHAFYNSAGWRRLRTQVKARDNGLCQECLKHQRITFADVVDHVIPIKEAWHLRLELSNSRSLCHACHNKKTAKDFKKYK